MVGVTRVAENKRNLLVENVLPNVYWNRFDLRYGEDWDLWKIESDFSPHYVASHLDDDQILVSMYLRKISSSIFQEFVVFLFGTTKKLKLYIYCIPMSCVTV